MFSNNRGRRSKLAADNGVAAIGPIGLELVMAAPTAKAGACASAAINAADVYGNLIGVRRLSDR